MRGITGIVIGRAASNAGRITVIRGLAAGAHLAPQEQRNRDQERGGHDQWRCQRF